MNDLRKAAQDVLELLDKGGRGYVPMDMGWQKTEALREALQADHIIAGNNMAPTLLTPHVFEPSNGESHYTAGNWLDVTFKDGKPTKLLINNALYSVVNEALQADGIGDAVQALVNPLKHSYQKTLA